jgi:hypothetical protein
MLKHPAWPDWLRGLTREQLLTDLFASSCRASRGSAPAGRGPLGQAAMLRRPCSAETCQVVPGLHGILSLPINNINNKIFDLKLRDILHIFFNNLFFTEHFAALCVWYLDSILFPNSFL